MNRLCLAALAGVATGFSGAAMAGPLVTFTYTNLSGQYGYDAGTDTGNFNAFATATQALQTDGSVSLVPGPGAGTAVFNPGFTSRTVADFQIQLSFFNRVGDMASGVGYFVAKDVLGNQLTGQLNGNWVMFGNAVFFNGAISNAVVIPAPNGAVPLLARPAPG